MTDQGSPNSGSSGDVLSSLPSARPQRRSPKRDGAQRAKGAKRTATAKPPATANAKPRATASTASIARKPATPRKQVAAQGYHPVSDSKPVEPPTGTEILASAVQAAGEIAQIGLTLGERLLRAAAARLPKP